MGSVSNKSPLVAIVGQTASGKSALALELAEQYNGEIICADSRTVYGGMDIGTAKPTPQEQRRVRHHLLDIAEPNQVITAAVFKQLAKDTIKDIAARGSLAFLVGGTGMYVDSVLFDFSFRTKPNIRLRQQLLGKTVPELQAIIKARNLSLPQNEANQRHLIRQIESAGMPANRSPFRKNTLVIGMPFLEKDELEERLVRRLQDMLNRGLEAEVRRLVERFGWGCPSLQTIGYQEFRSYFEGKIGIADVEHAIVRHSLQYAKRQKTWFKRNTHIHWICKKEEAVDLITSLLNKTL